MAQLSFPVQQIWNYITQQKNNLQIKPVTYFNTYWE